MRTSPRSVVGLFVILLFGSFILPILPNMEENPTTIIIDSGDEISQDIDGWDQLNDAQKKTMVDWSRMGDSQKTDVNSISSTSLLNCGNETGGWSTVHCGVEIWGLEFDSIGNLYFTGTYRTSAKFDEIILVGDNWNIFVAKLDVTGSWVWITDAGSEDVVDSSGLTVDSNGSVYIGGQYSGDITMGDTTLTVNGTHHQSNENLFPYPYGYHGFVSKLDNNGSWLWTKNISGDSITYVTTIALDYNEDLLISFAGCGYAYMDDISLLITPNDYDSGHHSSEPCSPDTTIAKLNSNGEWLWVSTSTSDEYYFTFDIHVDNNNNAYLVGMFQGFRIDFGNETSWNLGLSDGAIFVAKLDSNGTWLWAESAYGVYSSCELHFDWELASDIDSDGDVVITGGSTCHTGLSFGSHLVSSEYEQDVFIAKISSDGEWKWGINNGGDGKDKGTGVAIDSAGDIYSTGLFEGQITIGPKVLTSKGGFDVYLAKMDANGSVLWATTFGGTENELTMHIGVSNEGKVAITGYYRGTITLLGNELSNGGQFSGNKGDSFIFSLDATAASNQQAFELPLTKLSTTSMVKIADLAVDTDGNALITGYYAGTMVLGGNSLVSSSTTESAIFVAKLSKTGEWLWAVEAGENFYGSNDLANSIAIDDTNGDVYITGYFSGYFVGFGGLYVGSVQNEQDTGGDEYTNPDIFVAKLNSIGEWQWVSTAGGSGWDAGNSIAVSDDNVYVTGEFSNIAGFGDVGGSDGIWNSNRIEYSMGGTDIFVGTLDKTWGEWQNVLTAGGSEWDAGVEVDFIPSTMMEDEKVVVAGNCAWMCDFGYDNNVEPLDAYGSQYTTSGFIASATVSFFGAEMVGWDWLTEIDSYYGNSTVTGFEISEDNYLYITGNYKGMMMFSDLDSNYDWECDCFITTPDQYLWSNWNGVDEYQSMYVAAADTHGVWQWAQHVDSPNTEKGNLGSCIVCGKDSAEDIVVDSEGNIYLTGYYNDTAKWNNANQQPSMIANYYTIPSGEDIFVQKLVGFEPLFQETGYVEWSVEAGGSQHDSGTSISLDSSGVIYSVGHFQDYADFGGDTLISSGYENAYVSIGISTDFDGDGHIDDKDDFVFQDSQWSDMDGDGFGDNIEGYHGDSCPTLVGSSWQDRWGCPDMDGDGQSDLFDAYMQEDTQWNDTDGDGLGDNWDGVTVDRNTSVNGVGEFWADAYLPDPYPLDYDNDGFQDANLQSKGAIGPYDDCPLIYGKSTIDLSGCVDTDGDGRSDVGDSHPTNPQQWNDTDGDGYGDRSNSIEGDAYPNDPTQWSDYDGDGRGDNVSGTNGDAYPIDPTQWSDEDGDGFGDNELGSAPDYCPLIAGTSTHDVLGCNDGDGDGWSTLSDWDDSDATVWSDSDGDGFTDQLGHPLSDDCPGQPGNSSEMMRGCADMDGDGLPDIYDDDTDGDGISNSIERQAGHDPYDGDSTPKDFDNDGIPDSLDYDDDDDGFPDDIENERGSDSKDVNSTPLSMYGSQESGIFYVPGQGFSSVYQENGYELSISWILALVSSEFLVPLILLPLSVLLLMGKRRRFKKFKKKMGRIDQIDELEEIEEEIDLMIEKGSIKVEHAMLLRNQFERSREKLSGKSHMDRLFTKSRNSEDYQTNENVGRLNSRPTQEGPPPTRGPPRRGPPRRGPPPLR